MAYERDALVRDLCETYDLTPGQISFNANGEPQLNFDALQTMTHRLCTVIQQDEVYPNSLDDARHFISCTARLTLTDGREISRVDIAQIGESIGDGDKIETVPQAVNVASARAYRKALRAIGFNPIRVHLQNVEFTPTADDEDDIKVNRELHALASELGYIKGNDRTLYRDLIRTMYGGKVSTTQMTQVEVRELTAFLRQQAARLRRDRENDAELKAA